MTRRNRSLVRLDRRLDRWLPTAARLLVLLAAPSFLFGCADSVADSGADSADVQSIDTHSAANPDAARVSGCKSDLACKTAEDSVCSHHVCDVAAGSCVATFAFNGTPCVDGDVCSAESACKDGACVGVGVKSCECEVDQDCAGAADGNLCNGTHYCDKSLAPYTCTIAASSVVKCPDEAADCAHSVCVPATGGCASQAELDGTACDDNNSCTVGDACANGVCSAETNTCSCVKNADCDDQENGNVCDGTLYCDAQTSTCKVNPATILKCNAAVATVCQSNACQPTTGVCALIDAKNGTSCDDGDKCTGGEICLQGECGGGTGICPCTSNADCAVQDDGDFCNGTLYCDGTSGKCLFNPASVVKCATVNDSACTTNVCDPGTGACSLANLATGTSCDDGDVCTGSTTCGDKGCKGGVNLCPCAEDADCESQDDGDKCNGTLFCDKATTPATCQLNPTTIVTCPSVDDTACLKNGCNPKTGICGPKPAADQTPCDDGKPCTKGDRCVLGACVSGVFACECANNADCAGKDDGNLCNGTWFCDVGGSQPACAFNPASVVHCSKASDTACLKNVCDAKTGACGLQPLANQTVCVHPSKCAQTAVCLAAACSVTAVKACDDANPCTNDDCGEVNGCSHAAVGCDDGQPCTLDACNKSNGQCTHSAVAMNGKTCDADGTGCTANDSCNDGSCLVGVGVVCKGASGACDQPTCLGKGPTSHECVILPKKDGTPCLDGDACKLGAGCKEGQCVGGSDDKLFVLQRTADKASVTFADVAQWLDGYVVVGRHVATDGSTRWRIERLDGAGKSVWPAPHLTVSSQNDPAVGLTGVLVGDGNEAIVAGQLRGAKQGLQVHLMAMNPAGKALWQREHGGAGDEVVHRLVAHSSAGMYAVGRVATKGLTDGVVMRLSATGLLAWTWSGGGAAQDELFAGVPQADGSIIAAGTTVPNSGGPGAGWLVKIDAQAKTVWQQALSKKPGTAGFTQVLAALVTDSSGDMVAAGWHVDGALRHPWFVRANAAGNVVAQHSSTAGAAIHDVVQPTADVIWAVGASDLSGKSSDALLSGRDAQLLTAWQRIVDTGAAETLRRVRVTSDGGLLAVGEVNNGATTSGLIVRADAWGRTSCAASGICAAKKTQDCADTSACTDDLCDAKNGCVHSQTAKPCDDSDHCTTADQCKGGGCASGSATSCDDGNACTTDSCSSKVGCVHVAIDKAPCPDDSVCTEKEACKSGVCTISAKDCGDGNPCTQDSCDAKAGCKHQALADETACAAGKVCVSGTCVKRWAVELRARGQGACVRHPGGSVSCWGNAGGYLNNTYKYGFHVPAAVPNVSDVTEFGVAYAAACFRLSDGSVRCVGQHGGPYSPAAGIQGNGSCWAANAVAQPVAGIANVKRLTVGARTVLTLHDDGALKAWGGNQNFQLGTKSCSKCVPSPVTLQPPSQVVFAGNDASNFTCVSRKNGEVWCTGGVCHEKYCFCKGNHPGYPGTGTKYWVTTWTKLNGVEAAVGMAAGSYHRCLLQSDGGVRCWGANLNGEVGDGTKAERLTPVKVALPAKAVSIAAGRDHTCVALVDGTVRCWGRSFYGQLGNGMTFDQIAPTLVTGLTDAVAVAAGSYFSCALRKNGEVWCWGRNAAGAIGLKASTATYLTPRLIPASKAK